MALHPNGVPAEYFFELGATACLIDPTGTNSPARASTPTTDPRGTYSPVGASAPTPTYTPAGATSVAAEVWTLVAGAGRLF